MNPSEPNDSVNDVPPARDSEPIVNTGAFTTWGETKAAPRDVEPTPTPVPPADVAPPPVPTSPPAPYTPPPPSAPPAYAPPPPSMPSAWPQPGQGYSPPPPIPHLPPQPVGYGARPGWAGQSVGYYPASSNSIVVMVLGIVSIIFLQIILGPIALILGQRGVKLIDEGLANPAEKSNLNVGRLCGLFGTIIGVILMVVFVGMYVAGAGQRNQTLAKARRGFETQLISKIRNTDPLPTPPNGFSIVRYPTNLGAFPAIVADPEALHTATTKGKHPAIIWLVGGFSNEMSDDPWADATPDNDQSGSAFYKAGMVEMYPSLRGGNSNPGYVETCYGEVDDVLAAAKFLAQQPNVDPTHIYLGGHSTGGTLALLTAAASTGQFRAVFSFGPVADTSDYGQDSVAFDVDNEQERRLRAPNEWLSSIKAPTFVIEGDSGSSNIRSLKELRLDASGPNMHFIEVPDSDHFSELSRTTPVIAQKILSDTAPACNIDISTSDWPPAPQQ